MLVIIHVWSTQAVSSCISPAESSRSWMSMAARVNSTLSSGTSPSIMSSQYTSHADFTMESTAISQAVRKPVRSDAVMMPSPL